MSKLLSTVVLSIATLKMRRPACAVLLERLAKYRRTCSGVPAATGNDHCISGLDDGSTRSLLNTWIGVVAGTEASSEPTVVQLSVLLPVLWNADGDVDVSAAQSGPSSSESSFGPPASTRYSTGLCVAPPGLPSW